MAIPTRAAWLRALALERERLANHLGDLGYLGNDGGFAFGLAQCSRLKEDVLRTNLGAFGHRLLMDYVVPGGVARDLAPEHAAADRATNARRWSGRSGCVRDIYDEHAGLQDRFRTCGVVTPALAAQLGLTGMAGRASGQARDLRCDFPVAPYDSLAVRKSTSLLGDVAARVAVRFDEALESLRLIQNIVKAIPVRRDQAAVPDIPEHKLGLGYVGRLARAGTEWPSRAVPTGPSGVAIRTTRHGPTGRCSSMR